MASRSQCTGSRTRIAFHQGDTTMIKQTLLATLAITSGLVLSTTDARADVKCSPDIQVTYNKNFGTSIKVTKIQYRLDGTNLWHSEGVDSKVIDKGKTHTFKSQRLGNVAKGQKLDLRVIFKPDTGNDYGAEDEGPIRNSGKECENNVTYSLVVE